MKFVHFLSFSSVYYLLHCVALIRSIFIEATEWSIPCIEFIVVDAIGRLQQFNRYSPIYFPFHVSDSWILWTFKGKYDSHSSCINCSGCSRFNCCVQCHSWTDSIWVLAEKRRSFRGRQGQEEGIQRETAEGLSFDTLF